MLPRQSVESRGGQGWELICCPEVGSGAGASVSRGWWPTLGQCRRHEGIAGFPPHPGLLVSTRGEGAEAGSWRWGRVTSSVA